MLSEPLALTWISLMDRLMQSDRIGLLLQLHFSFKKHRALDSRSLRPQTHWHTTAPGYIHKTVREVKINVKDGWIKHILRRKASFHPVRHVIIAALCCLYKCRWSKRPRNFESWTIFFSVFLKNLLKITNITIFFDQIPWYRHIVYCRDGCRYLHKILTERVEPWFRKK